MKKTTRIASWKYVVSLTLSVLCTLCAIFVEVTAVHFAISSIAIKNAEADGTTITYTANGAVTWTEDQMLRYDNAVIAKKELIDSNDVAKFFSDMAGSVTGRIFRWVVVLLLMPAWVYISAKFAYAAVAILYWRIADKLEERKQAEYDEELEKLLKKANTKK